MKIPEEAICSICKQIFCCGKCREKHEIKKHAIRIVRKRLGESLSSSKENTKVKKDSIYVLCPICANRPFPLYKAIYAELLDHIERQHLPLHCQKCMKIYKKMDDLHEITKCVPPLTEMNIHAVAESSCVLNTLQAGIQQHTISTQTSPHLGSEFNGASSITPISIINLQWKSKAKISQEISDSATSFKNLSFITNSTVLRRSIGSITQVDAKGKLVRTTSTPVHAEMEHMKPKEQTFNASGAQVSSIYSSGYEPENHNSPFSTNNATGTVSNYPQQDAVTLYRKFSGRPKIAAVTPLRQVMSKSIQKAFAEHGMQSFADQRALVQTGAVYAMSDAPSCSPLDLRLSPALRRSQSDSFCNTRVKKPEKKVFDSKHQKSISTPSNQSFSKHMVTGRHLKTESFMVTRTKNFLNYKSLDHESATDSSSFGTAVSSISKNSVYKTCQSFEIITSSELEEISETEKGCSSKKNIGELCSMKFELSNGSKLSSQASITPITRLTGSLINKKAIQFETPKVKNKSGCETSIEEKFYTPTSLPNQNKENVIDKIVSKAGVVRNLSGRFSPASRSSLSDCVQFETDDTGLNDEVFFDETKADLLPDKKTVEAESKGFLKSIVSSVMRLPSLKENTKVITQSPAINTKPSSKPSIIKRCVSIAGSLVRSTSLIDENQLQTLKRKRTQTMDTQFQQYKPICRSGSVTSQDVTPCQSELNSTKRFRIQGRKPIERMRYTPNN